MSDKPSREDSLNALRRQAADVEMPNTRAAREIEAQAGTALTREFWISSVSTPYGELSRRSIVFTVAGLVFWIIVFIGAIAWRLSTPPDVTVLPNTDAFTVMTHIHANFLADKDPIPSPFQAPEEERWRFRDAYTFRWNGGASQAIVLSYANEGDLNEDYQDRTRPLNLQNFSKAVFRSPDMVAETRSVDNYGSQWKGLRLGNMLLLVSANTSPADQQVLESHFVSIVAAEHRDFIPTATP